MTKIIYLLDPQNGMLVGESTHPLDPVETARRGEPVYAQLNPALATEIAPPPIPAGMKAVLSDGAWALEAIPPATTDDAEAATARELPAELPPPSLEQRLTALQAAVQDYLDAMARSLGYDDIRTAVTYAEEPAVPKFQAEARALRAWRSHVWLACHQLLDRVRAAEAEEPTPETLVALLPKLTLAPLDAADGADTLEDPPDSQAPLKTISQAL